MRHIPASLLLAASILVAAIPSEVAAQTGVTPDRGELLYTTHCVACHNARVHWREKRLATDWNTLRAQVRRWQGVQKLRWNEDEITEVARYLNTFYYNFPSPEG